MDEDATLRKLEALLRKGNFGEVSRIFQRIDIKSLSKKSRIYFGNIARRAGLPSMSIRLLHPVVNPTIKGRVNPTEAELAEYAVALSDIGLHSKSYQILSRLSGDKDPIVDFYCAYVLFPSWNYEKALPHLRRYLTSVEPESYEYLVGSMNLAAALINEHMIDEAETIVTTLIKKTADSSNALLFANAQELLAQISVSREKYLLAKEQLETASRFLANTGSVYELFIKKWWAISDLFEHAGSPDSLQRIANIRAEAVKQRHWESVRDCDFFQANVMHDDELFLRVYFGTPYSGFHRRMFRITQSSPVIPASLVVHPDSYKVAGDCDVFDVDSGSLESGQARLREGTLLHRLFKTLSSDLYKPFSVASIYQVLFYDDYYDPDTSPSKVHQAIHRLRSWLKQNQLPICVSENDGDYAIQMDQRFALRLKRARYNPVDEDLRVGRLLAAFGYKTFSAKQAQQVLNCSQATFSRFITTHLNSGPITKSGSGRNTLYKIK